MAKLARFQPNRPTRDAIDGDLLGVLRDEAQDVQPAREVRALHRRAAREQAPTPAREQLGGGGAVERGANARAQLRHHGETRRDLAGQIAELKPAHHRAALLVGERTAKSVDASRAIGGGQLDPLVELDDVVLQGHPRLRHLLGCGAQQRRLLVHAYGLRTFKATQIALYHSMGALPEPKTAHTFF